MLKPIVAGGFEYGEFIVIKVLGAAIAAMLAFAAVPAQAGLVYIGTYAGNDNVSGNNNGANNDIHDEIFAYNMDTTIVQLAKINVCNPTTDANCAANGQSGSDGAVAASLFSLINNGADGSVDFDLTGTGYGLEYVVLKGSDNFAIFYWDMDPLAGSFLWQIAGFILNNGGQVPNLSHITFYGGDAVSDVPLPAAAWLMIAGLSGLGFAGRRKKAA